MSKIITHKAVIASDLYIKISRYVNDLFPYWTVANLQYTLYFYKFDSIYKMNTIFIVRTSDNQI